MKLAFVTLDGGRLRESVNAEGLDKEEQRFRSACFTGFRLRYHYALN